MCGINVDVNENRNFYAQQNFVPCDCGCCQNFYEYIEQYYPKICKYLESLGVDISQPWEVSALEPENGMLEYISCQYILFGSYEDDFICEIENVQMYIAKIYQKPDIKQEHFIIEFGSIFLPYEAERNV